MADAALYIVTQPPGGDAGWREALEIALTSAAFGLPTAVWLLRAPLNTLARRADAAALIAELTGFGIRCVASRSDLTDVMEGVEPLDNDALAALRARAAQVVVL